MVQYIITQVIDSQSKRVSQLASAFTQKKIIPQKMLIYTPQISVKYAKCVKKPWFN